MSVRQPEPDTAENPAAQAKRDRLMAQACDCGAEVPYDGGPLDHLGFINRVTGQPMPCPDEAMP